MQHTQEQSAGTRPVVIEVGGEPVGIAVPKGPRYRFVAVKLFAFAIEGQEFDTIAAVRQAAATAGRATESAA